MSLRIDSSWSFPVCWFFFPWRGYRLYLQDLISLILGIEFKAEISFAQTVPMCTELRYINF